MRLYPDIPSRRASTLARDLVTVALLVLLAWIALKVHDAVDRLAVLGQGVNEAGSSIEEGFRTAADAVDGAPLVGDDLADGLRAAGEESGGNVADLGREGEDKTHVIAMRAAFALPYGQLLAHTRDPLGDLEEGRYDTLVEAVLEDAGLRSARRKEDA